jgi:hypothetical protein
MRLYLSRTFSLCCSQSISGAWLASVKGKFRAMKMPMCTDCTSPLFLLPRAILFYARSKVNSPELGLIPTRPPPVGAALAPLVVLANCVHLRVWEVGWGNVPLAICGVLVRESRATCLAGARRGGAPPGLYR